MPVVRFVCVGVAAFVVDAAIVWILGYVLANLYVARAMSLCASIMLTFVLNRALTFSASGPLRIGEVASYVGASAIGIALNYAVYAVLIKLEVFWLIAMMAGTVVGASFNFIAYGRIFKGSNSP